MPELPEVETVRRGLETHVVGAEIRNVRVARVRLRRPLRPLALRQLVGRRIIAVRRRAKYLLLDLEGGGAVLAHLGMSGRLTVRPEGSLRARHDHVIADLIGADGRPWQLCFNDPRRFGLFEALGPGAEALHPFLRRLGREPLEPGLDGPSLARLAGTTQRAVKVFLLDGRCLVGVGNIYASEALFLARVHPATPAHRLDARAWQRLARAIVHVLRDAIEQGGTTLRDFANVDGDAGYFGQRLRVYDRTGMRCRRCADRVVQTRQGGRSTYH